MEDSGPESTYLNPCKVQLLNQNCNNMHATDKLRLSFFEEELQYCRSRISAYEKSTSFILAQLHLINSWIESSIESQKLINTRSTSYKNWMKNYNMDRITSIAEKIKYVSSIPRSNCPSDFNQEHEGGANSQTSRENPDSDLIVEDENGSPIRNEPQEVEEAEDKVHLNVNDEGNEIPELIEPLHLPLHCQNSRIGTETELELEFAGITKLSRGNLKEFPCHRCSKKFCKLLELNRHIRSHPEETPYKCEQCNVKVKTIYNLNRHIKYVHTKDVKHKCSYCIKSFPRQEKLVEHERRHIGEKSHSCPTCDKKFITSSERRNHEQIHSEEKTFKCTFCGESFRQKAHLTNHISTHTGERPYACSSCPKTFISLQTLKDHANTHTQTKPYKCELCGKCFNFRVNLNSHRKVHSGKIYTCRYCNKVMKSKRGSTRHMKKCGIRNGSSSNY